MSAEADFSQLLKLEEEYIQKMCNEIIAVKPDLVFTEKGVSGMGILSSEMFQSGMGLCRRFGPALSHEA